MKKIYNFIRSMRFGMLLLILIGVLCVTATVSGKENVYSSWYFILLFTVLGLNLTLCSVVRVFRMDGQKKALMMAASASAPAFQVENTEQWLKTRDHIPALTGLVCTLLSLLVFGKDNFLIPAMLMITLVLTLLRKREEGIA